jgi:hypothetical protein
MPNTDAAWERWGEADPYYGVLASPQFRRPQLSDHLSEFFASGEEYVAERLAKAERLYGFSRRRTAFEFGSGVGRLLIPLARKFQVAIGVDVSEAMIRECRSNLARNNLTNVTLLKSDDHLSAVSESFDFVISYIVLQHIQVRRGETLINRLLELTAIGGVVSLQIAVDRGDTALQAAVYWARRRIPALHGVVNKLRGQRFSDPLMEMNEYRLSRILRLLQNHGFDEVSVDLEQHGRVLSACLMARKSRD